MQFLPVDEHECVTFTDVEPLHSRELMTPGGVGDLQRADVLVARYHLPVRVLDGRNVRISVRVCEIDKKWMRND